MKRSFQTIHQFGVLLKIIVVLFLFNLVVERGMQLLPIYTLGDNFHLMNTLALSRRLPFFWTGIIVPLLYLLALWMGANFLSQYEKFRCFNPAVLANLRRCGTYLMYAAIAVIVIVPTAEAWINQGRHDIHWDWNISAISVGLIGMALKLVAQIASQDLAANDSLTS